MFLMPVSPDESVARHVSGCPYGAEHAIRFDLHGQTGAYPPGIMNLDFM